MFTPAPAPEGAEGMLVVTGTLYAYVNVSAGSTLTLRKAPSTSAAPVAYLSRGAQVRMIAFNDDWAYVRASSGASGFAARRYLFLPGSDSGSIPTAQATKKPEATPKPQATKKPAASSAGGFREVRTDVKLCNIAAKTRTKANMYQSYSTGSRVLGTLPAATRVTVLAYNNSWGYVSFGGRKGFIQLKYLKAL